MRCYPNRINSYPVLQSIWYFYFGFQFKFDFRKKITDEHGNELVLGYCLYLSPWFANDITELHSPSGALNQCEKFFLVAALSCILSD
jgi:hypothetical protein